MKNASLVVVLVVGLVLGLVVARMTMSPSEETVAAADAGRGDAAAAPSDVDLYKVPVGDAHVKGPKDALVTIVEFSDFECPFCGRVNPTLAKVRETFGDDVRVAFRHNPLPFHKHATLAAQAAEAAGAQGKFWEFHDKLFANQKALGRADLERYAEELGLDLAKFKAALDQGTFDKKVEADKQLAASLGARGTPSFFINGRFVRGAQPYPVFESTVKAALADAKALVKDGVRPADVYATLIKNGKSQIEQPKPQQAEARPARPEFAKVAVGDAHVKGPKDAKVTIIEWSDFQCPFCSRVVPTIAEIQKTYGDDVRIAFKHQPLPFHQQAQLAAEAAEAAGAQGKFWEFHDKLFANQKALQRADLERYAQELGLDLPKFKADLDSGKYTAKVKAQSAEGMKVGANGTPTFFINGRLLSGARPFPQFQSVIDEELKKADAMLKDGVAKDALYGKLLEANEKAYGGSAPAARPQAQQPAARVDVSVDGAPVKGPADAPITIVEWSDFQCPFCSRVNPTLEQLMKDYPGKIRVAFKHQPLPFHQNAQLAAEASMAAHAQGKFWEFHDKLFANQKALQRADLERYAKDLGLDMGEFKAALDSGKYTAVVKAQQQEGLKVGANGTPTLFVNGVKVVGAQPPAAFKTIIDAELAKAK